MNLIYLLEQFYNTVTPNLSTNDALEVAISVRFVMYGSILQIRSTILSINFNMATDFQIIYIFRG